MNHPIRREDYSLVWQTWKLVSEDSIETTVSSLNPSVHSSLPKEEYDKDFVRDSKVRKLGTLEVDWRQKIQIARIEKCISIQSLAEKVGCDVNTLSAFERGEEVIQSDLLSKIRKSLDI